VADLTLEKQILKDIVEGNGLVRAAPLSWVAASFCSAGIDSPFACQTLLYGRSREASVSTSGIELTEIFRNLARGPCRVGRQKMKESVASPPTRNLHQSQQ
jgi:hypothetical protein